MGLGNIFKSAVKNTINTKKAQGQIQDLKKTYLRNWSLDTLKDLCLQKGLSIYKKEVNPAGLESAIEMKPLGFYEIVELVSQNINSAEIIFYAKQNHVGFADFERKIREIKSFYGIN